MGCDGGTIPRRDELVRTKKKPEQKDKDSELSFRWQHCAISQEPLRKPIVACGLGKMYNKDTLIETLLDKSNLPDVAKHIKTLKGVKELNLTPNPAFKPSAEKGDVYIDRRLAPYICPIIGLEMNGKFKFVFPWTCGCVVSERALKELKTKVCHKCQQPFTEADVVVLNALDDDLDLMKVKMESRQAQIKAERKSKSSKNKAKSTNNESVQPSTSKETEDKETTTLKIKVEGSKLVTNGATKRAAEADTSFEDPLLKKTKESYSIAQDPGVSKVFKSLFTSHSSASSQTKAHWITYNPFYN